MKLSECARALFGGAAVYVAMAACSGSSARQTLSGASGAGGHAEGGIVDPVPNAEAQSGSRLKARWIVGSDGSRQFYGWRDTSRNEDCLFALSNGGLYCMPPGPPQPNTSDYVSGTVQVN